MRRNFFMRRGSSLRISSICACLQVLPHPRDSPALRWFLLDVEGRCWLVGFTCLRAFAACATYFTVTQLPAFYLCRRYSACWFLRAPYYRRTLNTTAYAYITYARYRCMTVRLILYLPLAITSACTGARAALPSPHLSVRAWFVFTGCSFGGSRVGRVGALVRWQKDCLLGTDFAAGDAKPLPLPLHSSSIRHAWLAFIIFATCLLLQR